jgi:hypothetical protein
MTLGRILALVWLAGLVRPLGGCGAKVQSLGENTGGGLALSTGGSGNAQDSGGSGAGGPTGGQSGVTGGTSPGPAMGGVGPGSGGGSDVAMGGSGGEPVPLPGGGGGQGARLSYPWAPTLPVDPGCTCPTTAEVCNAAGECVPRCDEEGRCALWLTERSIVNLYLDGSTLYYLTSATKDALENTYDDEALWSVVYPGGTPSKIAGDLGRGGTILGRVNGATYVTTSLGTYPNTVWVVSEISDQGQIRRVELGSICTPSVLGPDALYSACESGVYRIGLAADAAPEQLSSLNGTDSLTGGLALGDRLWCTGYYANLDGGVMSSSLYALDPTTPTADPPSFGWGTVLAASGPRAIVRNDRHIGSYLYTVDESGTKLNIFNVGNAGPLQRPRPAGNWIYLLYQPEPVIGQPGDPLLQRAPITVARLPQDVLPPALVSVMAASPPSIDPTTYGSAALPLYAVNDRDLFWVQNVYSETLRSTSTAIPQYIFHASLPPQPCDAELPCQHTSEVCNGSGFCSGGAGGASGTGDGGVGGAGGSGPVPDAGGSAGQGGAAPLSYPWNPTLPVDPQCTCPTSAEVCNAAAECVPRCDAEGRCALWLTDRSVVDLYVDGSTLYYLTKNRADALQNTYYDAALWRVVYPGGTPSKVAGDLGAGGRILGRAQNATYVLTYLASTQNVVSGISDLGQVRGLESGSDCYQFILGSDALYTACDSGIYRVGLTPGATPELLSSLVCSSGSESLALGQQLFCRTASWDVYALDPTSPTSDPPKVAFAEPLATSGSRTIYRGTLGGAMIWSQEGAGTRLNIFDLNQGTGGGVYTGHMFRLRVAGNWLYVAYGSDSVPLLQRAPISVARLPQDVLPSGLVAAATQFGATAYERPPFAVNDRDFFWVQSSDSPSPLTPIPQYIFHAPLPPQPCDAELPCPKAAAGQTCESSGFCGCDPTLPC